MNANLTIFERPEVKVRHDTIASSTVLAAMIISSLCGAFVVDVDSSVALAADTPARYAAVEEARR